MDKKFIEEFVTAIDTESIVAEGTNLADIEEWDSLGMVSFMTMVNATYGKRIPIKKLTAAKTVVDLYDLVKE